MIATHDLIESLVADLRPVRRLRSPLLRAVGWLCLAALVLSLLAVSQGLRPDLADRLRDPAFVLAILAALATGVASALATFQLSLPDRSPLWGLLPLPPLVLWLSGVGAQCLTGWVAIGPAGIHLGEAARCLATLVLTSLPLSLALFIMVRRARPLLPTRAALTGSLAVAAMSATALSLYHAADATVLILLFNLGTTALLAGLAALVGHALSSRRGVRAGMGV